MSAIIIDMEDREYTFVTTREVEEDNVKLWHEVKVFERDLADTRWYSLDHSPYEHPSREDFEVYANFFEKFRRFPNRNDLRMNGPIHARPMSWQKQSDLDKIREMINA